jgi:hypothetical protein
LAIFLKRYRATALWFLAIASVGCFILKEVNIPELRCRLAAPGLRIVSIVDISAQEKEIEQLSPRALFFGIGDEAVPEDLKLKEWEKMEYIEPVFLLP